MKIGLGSFAFRWAFKAGMGVDAFLAEAARLGADVVQLCENAGLEHVNEHDLGALAEHARTFELVLECGGCGARLDHLAAGVRRTAALQASIYRCVIDADGLSPQAVTDNLRALLPQLRDCRVTLCVENHFRFSPATVRRIVREVGDPAVAVCLDPLNSIAQMIGPDETVRELIDLTRTAHVKDALIERAGAGFVVRGVALGEGQIDLPRYVAAVEARAQSLLIESWMDPVDGEGGARTLEQEATWARNGLALIRKLTKRSSQ